MTLPLRPQTDDHPHPGQATVGVASGTSAASALMLVPLVWMLITSLSTEAETRRFPPGLPATLRSGNFRPRVGTSAVRPLAAEQRGRVGDVVVSNLILCSLTGYAFARINFAGRQLAFFAMLATLMVPFQVVMIPDIAHREAPRAGRHIARTDRAEPRDALRDLPPPPVLSEPPGRFETPQ